MSDSRVWLITGTSAGIGQALVKEVITAGERVAAITRRASSMSALSAAYPADKLLVIEFDVGNSSQSVEVLFEQAHKHFGRVDVVVNNAGYGLNSVVEGTSDEDARYQFEVNFWGPVRISREAIKYFRENKIPAGRVLNISSAGGFNANPTLAFYAASKFALEGFSEGLQKEILPEWNIKVITIQPGGVRTEWAKGNMVDRSLPPAYDTPDSPPNKMRQLYKNMTYRSDPTKLSRALITISREADPPLRLPLGSDAQYIILCKLEELKNDVEKWSHVTVSSDADGDVDPDLQERIRSVVIERS